MTPTTAGIVRRRCGYCDNQAIPGLRHYADWPVCAEHETPLCAAVLTINQTGEPDRVMHCAKASTHDGRHHNGEWGYSWEATDATRAPTRARGRNGGRDE